jgi:hypothetical protein
MGSGFVVLSLVRLGFRESFGSCDGKLASIEKIGQMKYLTKDSPSVSRIYIIHGPTFQLFCSSLCSQLNICSSVSSKGSDRLPSLSFRDCRGRLSINPWVGAVDVRALDVSDPR